MSDDRASTGASAGAATPLRTVHQLGTQSGGRVGLGLGGRSRTNSRIGQLAMPLVGRDEPLAQLDATLQRSIDYQAPQLVTLFGAPGMGKSRLLFDWCVRAQGQYPTALVVVVPADPADTNQPFALLRRLLYARLGWAGAMDPDNLERWEELRRELGTVFGDKRLAEILYVLAPFLGFSRRHVLQNAFLSALGQADEGLQAKLGRTLLRRFFELDAARRPLVLVVDDLHLADLDSLGVLDDLSTNLVGTSVMVVASARTDLLVRHPTWGAGALDRLRIDLNPLSPGDTEKLLRELLGRVEKLPPMVVRQICDHTAGTPAFVEQIVSTFFERDIVYSDGSTWRIDSERALDVNLTLTVEEAVHARLAELSAEERDLLEKAALLEGVFWTGAMVALDRLDRDTESPDESRRQIEHKLDDLASMEYLLRIPASSIPGESEFVFRHNMERELVARLVAPERARRYYRRVAQWLETKWSDLGAELGADQLEMKASYFERGGDHFRAAQSYLAAASQARHQFALADAARLYERALKLLDPEDALSSVDVLHGYGVVLILLGRSQEALPVFEDMLTAAAAVDQLAKVGAAHGRVAQIRRERGEMDASAHALVVAKEYFRRSGDTRGVALVEDQLGRLALDRGDVQKASEHHQLALDLRRALDDVRPVTVSMHQIAELHHIRGQLAEAEARYNETLALRRKHEDELGVVQTLSGLAAVLRDRGELQRALPLLAEAEELAARIGSKQDEAAVLLRSAELLQRLGKDADGDQKLRRAQSLIESMQIVRLEAKLGRIGAELALGAGDLGLAVRRARAAVAAAEKAQVVSVLANSERALALALAASGAPPDEVAKHFAAAKQGYEKLGAVHESKRTDELAALDQFDPRRARRATPPPLPPELVPKLPPSRGSR